MDALDRALEESLRRQREGVAPAQPKAVPVPRKTAEQPDPWSPEAAMFRAESEDDDGYDPYSDYMDQLNASSYEELEEDPWR